MALKLQTVGEGWGRLPHNGFSRERVLARAMTTKGPASSGGGGVQSQAHGSICTMLCRSRLAAPFRRGVQEGAQASEVQNGPSIRENMGRK